MGKALVIVDVQNDFCPGGSLATAAGAEVAAAIAGHVRERRGEYDVVVATQDWHIDPGGHFSAEPDFVDSWPEHCVAGTEGARLHPGLTPAVETGLVDAIFRKGQHAAAYSGFEGRYAGAPGGAGDGGGEGDGGAVGSGETGQALAPWLRGRGVDEIEVVGIATDYCVRATALDGVAEAFATSVIAPLTAAVHPENVQRVLRELRDAGAEVHAA